MRPRWLSWLSVGVERSLRQILQNQEIIMSQNAEVLAYAERIDAATNNIAADIKKILENPGNVLSDEDRATLDASVAKLEALAAERE
jgi:predicted outer membrane protein